MSADRVISRKRPVAPSQHSIARLLIAWLFSAWVLLGLTAPVCSQAKKPTALITDTTAVFFFPVENRGNVWGGDPGPGYNECSVEFPLGERLYWLQWTQTTGLKRAGSLSRLVRAGKTRLAVDVPALRLRSTVLDTALSAWGGREGVLVVLSDSLWHSRLVGARPDSVKFKVHLVAAGGAGAEWSRTVRVERRTSAANARRARIGYLRWLEASRLPDTKWDPKPVSYTAIAAHMGDTLRIFEETGYELPRDRIDLLFGPRFYSSVVPGHRSFALRGNRLFVADGSFHEIDLPSGRKTTHLRAENRPEHGVREYVDVSVSPGGQYVVVVAENSSAFAVLWDIAQERAVADVGAIERPLWSSDGSVVSGSFDAYNARTRRARPASGARGSTFRLFDGKDVYTATSRWVERRPLDRGLEFAVSVTASRPEIVGLSELGLYFREGSALKRLNADTEVVETIHANVGDASRSRIRLVYLFETN